VLESLERNGHCKYGPMLMYDLTERCAFSQLNDIHQIDAHQIDIHQIE